MVLVSIRMLLQYKQRTEHVQCDCHCKCGKDFSGEMTSHWSYHNIHLLAISGITVLIGVCRHLPKPFRLFVIDIFVDVERMFTTVGSILEGIGSFSEFACLAQGITSQLGAWSGP